MNINDFCAKNSGKYRIICANLALIDSRHLTNHEERERLNALSDCRRVKNGLNKGRFEN